MKRIVRSLVLPCVALAGVTSSALAADLQLKAPYVSTWTGWYAGVHAGYVWDDPELVATANSVLTRPGSNVSASAISPPGSLNDTSGHRFNGGAQLGYNLQTGIWVYGIETDISAGRRRIGTNATVTGTAQCISVNGNGTCNGPTTNVAQNMTTSSFAEAEVDWYGTLRARLGVARDRWMAYASGGLAYGSVKVTNTGSFAGTTGTTLAGGGTSFGVTQAATNNTTKAGWAAGIGGAFAWSDTVSLFAEWTRVDLGTASATTGTTQTLVPGAGAVSGTAISDVAVRFDVISVGLNIKL